MTPPLALATGRGRLRPDVTCAGSSGSRRCGWRCESEAACMSRYYHVVEAEQVEISEAGVLPRGMKWMGDRWAYLTSQGILWPRSGDWIVTDQNGRAAVLRDEEFQRVYVPCPQEPGHGVRRPVTGEVAEDVDVDP